MTELDAKLVRDHIGGLEMQLVNLVEQLKSAEGGWNDCDSKRLERDLRHFHAQLSRAADVVGRPTWTPMPPRMTGSPSRVGHR